jgi:hypothetical protein
MRESTNVLLFGIEEWSNALRQALPPRQKDSFWGVSNVWDLCDLPQAVSVDVAVFHHSFAPHELRYAAEYIRRRWPDAVILVIGEQARQLDDPLYDHRMSRGISLEELVWMIETSVAEKRRISRNVLSWLSNTRW